MYNLANRMATPVGRGKSINGTAVREKAFSLILQKYGRSTRRRVLGRQSGSYADANGYYRTASNCGIQHGQIMLLSELKPEILLH